MDEKTQLTPEQEAKLEEQRQWMLKTDREDLVAILTMLFGPLPADVQQKIDALDDVDKMNRLIIVAANATSLEGFVSELELSDTAFRILSPSFQFRPPGTGEQKN